MSDKMTEFTEQNWEREVLASPQPVLVDFWAPWCAPCRQIATTLEAMVPDYAGRLKIGALNVADHSGLAARYGVCTLPTLLVLKAGKVVEQRVGLASRIELARIVDEHLGAGG